MLLGPGRNGAARLTLNPSAGEADEPMSYLAKRLAEHESVRHCGRFHWLQKLAPWLALIFLGWLVIGIFLWIGELVRLRTTEFMVTNRRILLKRGLFSVRVDEMNLSSIEGGHIRQSLIGRMFGFGRLLMWDLG